VRKENQSRGVSFDLPEWPTVGQIEDYQLRLRDLVTNFKGTLTDVRLYALIHIADFETGLASGWQCERMPDPLPDDERQADGAAIGFSGNVINEQVKLWTEIPLA
jgi:hypothetical protein